MATPAAVPGTAVAVAPERTSSLIYTFYSFKGGVGRTMGLANVAELLYRRGIRVLMIDFDLEAPGLERFFVFPEDAPIQRRRGVMDMLCSYRLLAGLAERTLPAADWDDEEAEPEILPVKPEPLTNFMVPVYGRNHDGGELALIPAGRRDGAEFARYAERLRTFDWEDFYLNWHGKAFFDWFWREAGTLADIVLIDSRTGITEMSGVCTFQLADVVVMWVATNRQNLDGTRYIADGLGERKDRKLWRVVVPSRVENSESDALKEFKRLFEATLKDVMSPELAPTFGTDGFTDLRIPYIPRYAIMEQVAVREPDQPVAADLIAAYTRLASAMVALAPPNSRLSRKFLAPSLPSLLRHVAGPLAEPIPNFIERPWVLRRLDDWLARPEPRIFLITGEPGTGKTAVANRLVRLAEGATASEDYTRLGRGALAFAHACQAEETTSLDPTLFVEALALSLADRYPAFAAALSQVTLPEIEVEVRQTIDAAGAGSKPAAPTIAQIRIGPVAPGLAFDLIVRRPLAALCTPDFSDAIVLLVDGVDAALAFQGNESIFDLLRDAVSPNGGVPPQVRLVLTSRPDPRVLAAFPGERLDLLADAPSSSDAVRDFAMLRLQQVEANRRATLAARLAEASAGNLLFAYYAIAEVLSQTDADKKIEIPALPTGLKGKYEELLSQQVAPTSKRWARCDRPLLGVLAVAQDDGLSAAQLADILKLSDSERDDAMRAWGQYLSGPWPDGPFRLFHPSFRAFLLAKGPFQIYPAESHLAIADNALKEYGLQWRECRDDYALRFTVAHLLAAIDGSENRRARATPVHKLQDLVLNSNYLEAKIARLGRDAAQADRDGLIRAAASPRYGEELATLRQRLLGAATPPEATDEAAPQILSGIDAQTGQATPEPTARDVAQIARATEFDRQQIVELRWRHRLTTEATLAPVQGIDPADLAQTGWGVVFAGDADPAIRKALAPLLDHRRAQAGATREGRYREFWGGDGYRPGESKAEFLARLGAGPGPVDPDKVPYYLLLIGEPATIPFDVQSQLMIQHAVGRLSFDTAEGFARYAHRIVEVERGGVQFPPRAVCFGTRHPDDFATRYSAESVVQPLADRLSADRPGWQVNLVLGEGATKARFGSLLKSKQPPALLAATGHGLTYAGGQPRQRDEQGALLCQDWPGPVAWRDRIPDDFYFAGHDVKDAMRSPAFVFLFHTSYGAGTARSEVIPEFKARRQPRREIAPHSFVARLPQRLLGHPRAGALAVVGQVGEVWVESPPNHPADLLAGVLNAVADGDPIGAALETLSNRYAERAVTLAAELEEIRFGKVPNDALLSALWASTSNFRGLTLLGDPAARLPLEEGPKTPDPRSPA